MNKAGYLVKEGGRFKSWKKRWCVIEGDLINYYRKDTKKEKCGSVNLRVASKIQSVEYRNKKNCFEIVTPERVYHMCADSVSEKESWIEVLCKYRESLLAPKTQSKLPTSSPANNGTNSLSNAKKDVKSKASTTPKKKITVEDFELLKVIGKGSFGKVIQVRKKDTRKIYAMKILHKQTIIERNEVEHTKAERSILMKLEHPFLVKLYFSFQDPEKLYFVMDYVNGGELFFHLQKEKQFTEDRVRFYAAEIASGLEYLHTQGIIYRDLKPENLLLHRDGHIIMTDFGLSKEGIKDGVRTGTFCGTPEYLAPEVLEGKDYGKAVDWWSFGTLIYEMLTGLPPFYSEDIQAMYTKILSADLRIPAKFSPETKDLIEKLLDRNPLTRLSNPDQIRAHPYFASIDWGRLLKKQVKPPFIPDVKGGDLDIANFDKSFTEETPNLNNDSDEEGTPTTEQQGDFENFTYAKTN
eukprot:TRINITY_DN2429_c0_g1_i1.p1 TRINITY_DN2429_c0_g1~~TRINITY_DN2429_c0_g1_i1.p1  ORF type:complete len:466 (+),score=94.61 TRINITY_DN2429_c0_g1_i1:120-1517(+)